MSVSIKNMQPWYHQAKNLFCMTEAEAYCTDCIYTQLSSYDPWLASNAICQSVELKHSLNFSQFPEFFLMEGFFLLHGTRVMWWSSLHWIQRLSLFLYNKTFSRLAKVGKEGAHCQLEADKKDLSLWSYGECSPLG